MIRFPTSVQQACAAVGEYRAGGTDLMERRRHGLSARDIVDLRDVPGLDRIESTRSGGLRIGARVTLRSFASDPELAQRYPGLTEAARKLATPQIRAVATLGGNLLARNRCWYFRSPEAKCLQKGGHECLARAGDHLFHACFDLGPCVAVHPSTMAMALTAYDATVEIAGGPGRTIDELYGDGSHPRGEHRLRSDELLTAVVLPVP